MTDGSIRVKTKIDNSGVEGDLRELNALIDQGLGGETANKINRLSAQWEKLSARQSENNVKIREYKAELAELNELKALNLASGLKSDAIIAGEQTAQMAILQQKLERAEANGKGLSASMEKVGVDAGKVTQELNRTDVATKNVAQGTRDMNLGISSGIGKLARYAGALFGIRSVYMGLRQLSSHWLASDAIGAQQVQANIMHIKNTLAGALAPVITWITDKLMLMFGYVQAILKGLFGWELSVGKTASSMGSAAGSTGGVAKGAKDATKGLKKAGKEAKKLQKQMAGFDEMNVLTPDPKDSADSGGGGGAGGGGAGLGGAGLAGGMMPQIQTPDISGLLKIFDEIKKVWMAIWESDTMQSVVDSMTRIWRNTIDMWSSIGANLWRNILKSFQLMLPNLKRGFANTIELWRQVLEDIADYTDKWYPIFTKQINDIVDSIFDTFNPLLVFMAQLWADITEVVLEVWNEFGADILDAMGQLISNMYQTFQRIWTEIIDPVITPAIVFLKDMWDRHVKDILKQTLSLVSDMILQALRFYNKFVQPIVNWVIDWMGPKVAKGFKAMLKVVTIVMDGFFDVIKIVLDTVQKAFKGFMKFLEGVFTADWKKAWEGISDIFESVLDGVYKIADRILKMVSKLFKGELDLVLVGVKKVMDDVKQVFQGVIDFIVGVFTGDWQRAWDGVKNIFKGVFNGIFDIADTVLRMLSTLFSGRLDGILGDVSRILGNIKGVFQGLVDFVAGVFTGNWGRAWRGVVKVFENIVKGIANIFKLPLNAMIDGVNSFIRSMNRIQVPDWVPGVGGKGINISTIPRLARGGVVNRATLAEVGEGRHSEAVIPLDRDNAGVQRIADLIASQMQGGGGGDEMVNVVVNLDGNVLYEAMVKAQRDKEYRTNGRPNYDY